MTDSRLVWPHLQDREQFKRFYDSLHQSPSYDWRRWQFEWLKEFDPKPGSSILDLGCSSGRNVLHYARLGHAVFGLDVSEVAFETFQALWKNEPEEVQQRCGMYPAQFIEGFLARPGLFGHTNFDNVLLTEVLEHVTDPVPVLKVARAALAPAGEAYVSAPTYHRQQDPEHVRGVTEAPLRHWCKQAGLEVFYVNQGRRRIVAKLRRAG